MEQAEDKLILVVDDEPNVRQYLRAILEDAGFLVDTAADGEEALAKMRARKPAFVSLDLNMPKKGGHKVLYEMRKDTALARVPVLIVTAHAKTEFGREAMEEVIKDCLLTGPGVYMEKPVTPAAYVNAVRQSLGMPPAENAGEKAMVKDEIRERLAKASPEALRRALDALKQ